MIICLSICDTRQVDGYGKGDDGGRENSKCHGIPSLEKPDRGTWHFPFHISRGMQEMEIQSQFSGLVSEIDQRVGSGADGWHCDRKPTSAPTCSGGVRTQTRRQSSRASGNASPCAGLPPKCSGRRDAGIALSASGPSPPQRSPEPGTCFDGWCSAAAPGSRSPPGFRGSPSPPTGPQPAPSRLTPSSRLSQSPRSGPSHRGLSASRRAPADRRTGGRSRRRCRSPSPRTASHPSRRCAPGAR